MSLSLRPPAATLLLLWLASKCLEDAPKPERPAAPVPAAPKQRPRPRKAESAPVPPAPPKQRP